MKEFLKWLEDEAMDSFFMEICVVVCLFVVLAAWAAICVLTYGAGAMIPFVIIIWRYRARKKDQSNDRL